MDMKTQQHEAKTAHGAGPKSPASPLSPAAAGASPTELENLNLAKEPRETLVEFSAPEYVEDEAAAGGSEFVPPKKAGLSDVLSVVLPDRRWRTDEGFVVRQKVSSRKAERDDVVRLQMRLDERLQERQARENGLCPVREQLYSQAFDELIRQVTIERPERGLLLLRVRDEVRMTISAYQTLYKSSITFGMRKSLQAERSNTEVHKRLEELQQRKKELEAGLQKEKSLLDQAERETADRRALSDKKMRETKEFLKFQAQHLEAFLKQVTQQQAQQAAQDEEQIAAEVAAAEDSGAGADGAGGADSTGNADGAGN